jgi:hypothetical protein
MSQETVSRRALLIGATALVATFSLPGAAQDTGPAIHVLKDPGCSCCGAWIDVIRAAGFTVTIEASTGAQLTRYKIDSGIPLEFASCHTARVDGYMIEGHVPPADILRLLVERPDAIGLTVPGMPYGSPGMGSEAEREAYEVLLIHRDGSTEVFASYVAA